ncbi:MAG: MBL fold metallo-hydrolase [Duncaniella sp.]|nr:MBL fold metallo-hydrolase [Duncaniella sp.]
MKVSRFVFSMFGVNTYVMWDPESSEAAIVDPGMIDEKERDVLDDFISRNNLKVTQLLNTHMHLDHIFGNAHVKEKYGLEIKAHPDDNFLGLDLNGQASRFHLPLRFTDMGLDVELHDGDTLYLGEEPIKVISVPGHSPGSVALYCPESGFVITGDAVFKGSIGRTDLPGGNQSRLLESIRTKLFPLPDDTVILPGHGPESTVGFEKSHNPFF